LTVSFTGLEALWRRIDERNQDEAARKKFLEDQVKEDIPIGSRGGFDQAAGMEQFGDASDRGVQHKGAGLGFRSREARYAADLAFLCQGKACI